MVVTGPVRCMYVYITVLIGCDASWMHVKDEGTGAVAEEALVVLGRVDQRAPRVVAKGGRRPRARVCVCVCVCVW